MVVAPLSHIWSQGFEALVLDLKDAGFSVQFSAAQGEHLKKNFDQLRFPCALGGLHKEVAESYAYLGAGARPKDIPDNVGLLLIDEKSDPNSESLKARPSSIVISHAEAAMDFILQKISFPEWSGKHSFSSAEQVLIEENVTIGPQTEIGEGTVVEAGCRIGARVKIGRRCRIGAGSRIADFTVIGEDCHFTGPVSLGGQGFGFVQYPGESRRRMRKHIGRVVIEDQVRLGAFVAIDRGVFSDTVIRRGTSLDNLIQIGHNCSVGENSILCAMVGLSGSTSVGDRTTIAGLSGTNSHVHIGSDVLVGGQSGINGDIADGAKVKGSPPMPMAEALKIQLLQTKLPELYERLKKLEKAAAKS